MEPRQFPLLVEEGAVHQIQKPNCAGPEHVVFLQEKELGSALALKTIPGEALVFSSARAWETVTNAAIAPKKRTVTKFRRVAIGRSLPGFRESGFQVLLKNHRSISLALVYTSLFHSFEGLARPKFTGADRVAHGYLPGSSATRTV
jgi:hypothetical protein